MAKIILDQGMLDKFSLLQAWKWYTHYKKPHASIRIGDGELGVLAHDVIFTMDFMRHQCAWIDDPVYCGVTLPNIEAREQLADAVRQADYIGWLVQKDYWYFKPLHQLVDEFYQFEPKQKFYAFANDDLARTRQFYDTFRPYKVLLVGNTSHAFKEALETHHGWQNIVATIPCSSWEDLQRAKEDMTLIKETQDFDVAFISAGVPAKMLAIHAKQLGAVGIDFGSGADVCVQSHQDGFQPWDWDKDPKYSGH